MQKAFVIDKLDIHRLSGKLTTATLEAIKKLKEKGVNVEDFSFGGNLAVALEKELEEFFK